VPEDVAQPDAGTGVEQGSVAESQGQQAPQQSQATETTSQDGGQDQRVEQAFAARLSQEREKLNKRIQELFGYSLEELEQARAQQPQPAQPVQPQYPQQVYPQPVADPNEFLRDALLENPSAVISALGQIVQNQTMQAVAPFIQGEMKRRVASKYQDFEKVGPVVEEILARRPDLAMSEQGVELAYFTARGILADQLASEAASSAAQNAQQVASQMQHADARSGEITAQGGGTDKTPEQALVDMILNAEP